MKKVKQLFDIDVTDDVADAILIGKYAYNKYFQTIDFHFYIDYSF